MYKYLIDTLNPEFQQRFMLHIHYSNLELKLNNLTLHQSSTRSEFEQVE